MSEPYIGEIRMFGGNFAPRGWAFCDGQLLSIAQNSALFSILGTIYGGDGRTTFALPDLRGRVAIGPGNGPGLSSYREGQRGGTETVTLNTNEIPSHSHTIVVGATEEDGNSNEPNGNVLANSANFGYYTGGPEANVSLGGVSAGNTGGNLSHENRQPFLAIYYIIALQGIFPPRS